MKMISFFQCEGTGQRLSILDYDESRINNVKYRTVISDNQVAVLHLQSVDIKDTPISQLSLCPGVLEADMSEIISESASSVCALFLIEKAEEEIVYRSRSCRLVQTRDHSERLCESCEDLISRLRHNKEEESILEQETELKPHLDEVTKFVSSDVAVSPVVIRILKPNTEAESVPTKRKYKKMKNRIQCPDCPEMFLSKLRLKRHAKILHRLDLPLPVEKEPIKCPFCDEKFLRFSTKIPFHLKCFHLDEKENPLYVEMMGRVEVETIKYICQFCAKDFKTAGCLERHLNQYHQQGSFSCDQCSKCYKDEFRLTMHIKRKHAGPYKLQRDFLCVECGKCLTSKASLDNHIIRFHSDQNRLVCQECSREFRHSYDLVRHIGQVHTAKEKTEHCTQCEARFYNSKALQLHVRSIHEKLKPWFCEVCPFKCSRLTNLNDHRRKTHKETNLSKQTLIAMVEQGNHPFYNIDDLPMIKRLHD